MRARPNGFDVNRPCVVVYADTERDCIDLMKLAFLLVSKGFDLTTQVVRTKDSPTEDGRLGYFCYDSILLYDDMMIRPNRFRAYRSFTRYANKACKRLGYDRFYVTITYDAPTETSWRSLSCPPAG